MKLNLKKEVSMKKTNLLNDNWPVIDKNEKTIDTVPLNKEIPQEFRALSDEMETSHKETNWSQEDDRSEDLINTRDPFMQQPERDSEIPPELNQEHYAEEDEYADLAAQFEDERKPRKYHSPQWAE
jgi:hypothetical protein